MNRWRLGIGIVGVLLLCGCGAAILFPVFASAKVAAQHTRDLSDAKRFSQALALYTESHRGLLPGRDWREGITRVDPTLATVLRHQEGEWTTGYAAIPGTVGKKLEALPPETVLFVQYQWVDPLDILGDVDFIGNPHSTQRAFAITVQSVFDGWARPQPLARIGLLLGRQGVPGLK